MDVLLNPELEADKIDRMIAEGLEDIQRGETIDGEAAFQQLRTHSAEQRRESG